MSLQERATSPVPHDPQASSNSPLQEKQQSPCHKPLKIYAAPKISALVLVHHGADLGMTEIGLIQQYSSQQPMAESVIRFVTFT